MAYKILIVDDDTDLMEITKDMLCGYGYEVKLAVSSDEAFSILEKSKFDLILLDINLPDETGFFVCKELRKVSKVPVIFASARTSEDDKITGLDIGGDDYISKPYSLKELLDRIKAIIRRTYGEEEEKIYKLGKRAEIEVNATTREVTKDGTLLKLSLKEFDILKILCENAGKIVTKEEILYKVWGAFSDVEIATIAVHIRWLREKLEDNPAKPEIIETVWGVGYKLTGVSI